MDTKEYKKQPYTSQDVKLTYCGLRNDITGFDTGKAKSSKFLGEFAVSNKGFQHSGSRKRL